jgi:virginiamycin B lyase
MVGAMFSAKITTRLLLRAVLLVLALLSVCSAIASASVRLPGLGYTVTQFTAGVIQPDHVTKGPDGNVWFTETGAGRVSYIDASGVVHTPVDSPGSFPYGITSGPDGHIWFTEFGIGIAYIDGSGVVHELKEGATPGFSAGSGPSEITSGPDGHVWFTEGAGSGAVAYIDDGVVHEFRGGQTPGLASGSNPFHITSGPDGHVWFTESGDPNKGIPAAVAYIDGSGAVHQLKAGVTPGFSAGRVPGGITAGPDGHIWFTEIGSPGAVAYVDNSGFVHEFTGGATRGFTAGTDPWGIASGPDGHVWFVERSDPGRVAYIDTCGVHELTGGITPGFSANGGPSGITSGADGHVWFTELNSPGRLGRVNPPTLRPELCLVARAGGTISYRDTVSATTTFTVERSVLGRRSHRRCVRWNGRRPPRPRRCTLLTRLGTITHADSPGLNTVRIPGWMSGKSGAYTLSAVATSGAGTSDPLTAKVTIAK